LTHSTSTPSLFARSFALASASSTKIDAGYLPAALREVHRVAAGPAADVERPPRRRASGRSNSGRHDSSTFRRSQGRNPNLYINP
jgi:hypothetical protein